MWKLWAVWTQSNYMYGRGSCLIQSTRLDFLYVVLRIYFLLFLFNYFFYYLVALRGSFGGQLSGVAFEAAFGGAFEAAFGAAFEVAFGAAFEAAFGGSFRG